MTHIDLFSGIGGFALATEEVWPGIEHVFVEIDPFCRQVLKKHWPQSYAHGDIRTFANAREYDSMALCQPNDSRNTIPSSKCTIAASQSRQSQDFSGNRGSPCTLRSNEDAAYSGTTGGSEKTTASTGIQEPTDMHRMPLNTLSEKESSKERRDANHAVKEVFSGTEERASKPTTQTIINRCQSCGYVKNAITNGIEPTKRFDGKEVVPDGILTERPFILTGGFP